MCAHTHRHTQMEHQCEACRKVLTEGTACQVCNEAIYCDAVCAERDWDRHATEACAITYVNRAAGETPIIACHGRPMNEDEDEDDEDAAIRYEVVPRLYVDMNAQGHAVSEQIGGEIVDKTAELKRLTKGSQRMLPAGMPAVSDAQVLIVITEQNVPFEKMFDPSASDVKRYVNVNTFLPLLSGRASEAEGNVRDRSRRAYNIRKEEASRAKVGGYPNSHVKLTSQAESVNMYATKRDFTSKDIVPYTKPAVGDSPIPSINPIPTKGNVAIIVEYNDRKHAIWGQYDIAPKEKKGLFRRLKGGLRRRANMPKKVAISGRDQMGRAFAISFQRPPTGNYYMMDYFEIYLPRSSELSGAGFYSYDNAKFTEWGADVTFESQFTLSIDSSADMLGVAEYLRKERADTPARYVDALVSCAQGTMSRTHPHVRAALQLVLNN